MWKKGIADLIKYQNYATIHEIMSKLETKSKTSIRGRWGKILKK